MRAMTISETIKALGGPGHIASELGVTPNAVHKMRERGRFPAIHYFAMARMAGVAGFVIDVALFERPHRGDEK
jgi:hypothetical protein